MESQVETRESDLSILIRIAKVTGIWATELDAERRRLSGRGKCGLVYKYERFFIFSVSRAIDVEDVVKWQCPCLMCVNCARFPVTMSTD
ncbi:hypothetical protein [Burkholderia sp. ABCPW 11]|uniref:hypothetical protein n=1 Tax=Burkholderia sp. ABCPW 11 TaxID=1637859 RepID=UPI0012FD9941|nr:hypothetical protein [Burkholderia sp. ABCPW 11]